MTSDLHWVDLKTGINNQMKQTVVKKDSYSSDSLEEFCEGSTPDSDKSKISSNENSDLDMNNDKSLSQSSSDISSVHDNTSITSTYSFEIVEETEALQTENITESVDIRISPRNSTVMSFNCSNNFYSEFSLVANVEVQIPDANENFDNTKNGNESEDVDTQAKNVENSDDVINNEEQSNAAQKPSEIQSFDVNANESKNVENNEQSKKVKVCEVIIPKKSLDIALDPLSASDPPTKKKTEYYANKIEITKPDKKISSSVEKKIAEEIKEMKEREEDLKAMREKLAKEMSEKAAANKTSNINTPEIVKSEKVSVSTPNCDQKPVIKKASTEKVENSYIKACVFAIKRKDASVKNDVPEMNNKSPSAITQQESPVEREIRIAKEREEELKREREQALKSKLEMDSFNSESANETDADSALSICSDSSFDSVSKLAPLFPRNVSPEISNGNGISLYSSSAGSICSLESLSQRERQTTGSLSIGGSTNGSVLSPSPDSANCKPGYPFTSPREKRSKSIDMERFISSKGKEIKFRGDSVNVGGFNSSYYEIKPPQVKKGDEMTCKRFITAASKIKNELKEMQEREEQFKKERENRQQDIKNIKNGEGNEKALEENNTSIESPTSSPTKMDLPDSPDELEKSNNKQENSANTARRRSVLIDEWEQRIQKSISQP